jgi:hypothetical protein
MLVEKKMGWTLGGKFELPTWFITLFFLFYRFIHKLGTGCKDTLVICNSAFMAFVI